MVKPGKNGYILGCTNYKDDRSGCGRVLNLEHYRIWRRNDFGVEDRSVDKPSFLKSVPAETLSAPKMIPAKERKPQAQTSGINRVGYAGYSIGTTEFQVLTDAEGHVPDRHRTAAEAISSETDWQRGVAFRFRKSCKMPTWCGWRRTNLRPRRNSFVFMGVGERKYENSGDEFIAEIRSYVSPRPGEPE